MSGKFLSLSCAVALFAVCAASLTLAVQNLALSLGESRIITLGKVAASGMPISNSGLAAAISEVPYIINTRICRSDVLLGGMRLLLVAVNRRQWETGSAELEPTLQLAETYLHHAIGCLPMNGDVWLRLAMIRFLRYADDEEVAYFFNRSRELAPANGGVIEGRLALAQQFSPELLKLTRAARDADRATICGHMSRERQAQLAVPCPRL